MIGASFQPGVDQGTQRRPANGSRDGYQEAIKVLSLRLPKVVGAHAVAPSPLLTSQGSGGNPRVDSVVESVLSQMFPTQRPQSAPTPTPSQPMPTQASSAPTMPPPVSSTMPITPPPTVTPVVTPTVAPAAPMEPIWTPPEPSGPTFTGQPSAQEQRDYVPPPPVRGKPFIDRVPPPHITVDVPFTPDQSGVFSGGGLQQPGTHMIDSQANPTDMLAQLPDLRALLEWVPPSPQPWDSPPMI